MSLSMMVFRLQNLKIMNNELEWEKVLQWNQNQNTYILHVITNQEQISIEAQDKYTGDIWNAIFSIKSIEELTTKAKYPKKFSVFIRMLISALLRNSDSLTVEILSYRQMNNKYGRPGSQSTVITPQQASKRFLLLTYVGQFQQMKFPLPLLQFPNVSSARLKFTINRMANELRLLREGQSEEEMVKQNALLKYQNQSLKNKIKTNSRIDTSTILQPKLQELQAQNYQKDNKIQSLSQELLLSQSKLKESQKLLKQTQDKVSQLQEILKEYESSENQNMKSQKKMAYYQQKIEEMINQMNDLSADLTYSRQKQKKCELKIHTLQKQLETMISNKRTVTNTRNSRSRLRDNSPDSKRSEKSLSVKSGRSNTSQKSLTNTRNINKKTYNTFGKVQSNINTSNSKKQPSKRKSSIYDSDTESSRMRKMATGRSSPYRQTTNVNKKNPQRPTNQRSRSKSKERVSSPKPSLAIESQMMTEGYQSESSDEEQFDRIQGYLKDLKQRKGIRNVKAVPQNSGKKIQNRLQTLQQMIRKAALSTSSKN